MSADTGTHQRAPKISFTEEAVAKLRDAIANYPEPVAGLRLKIMGRGPEGFQHVLSMVEKGAEPPDDVVVEAEGLTVYVESRNLDYLHGVSIDYQSKGPGRGPGASGLEFDNPNPLWLDPIAAAVQEIIDSYINPSIASHGGYVNLLDVRDQRAYIEMGGGCQGCGMANVTLKQGIEVAIKEAVPSVQEVVDSTDHASGTNPYFQQSKK